MTRSWTAAAASSVVQPKRSPSASSRAFAEQLRLQLHATVEVAVGVDEAHRHHRVGDGRLGAAATEGRRAGGRARALRSDLRHAALGDPADRAAAGADRDHVDDVDPGLERAQVEVLVDVDLVFGDDPGVEAGPAHVAEQDPLEAHPLGQLVGADRAAGRARAEQPERVLARFLEADAAAEALEEGEPAAEAGVAQLRVQRGQVDVGFVLDEGVEHRGRPAPGLARDREDAVRLGDEEVRVHLLDRRGGGLLVLAVGVAPEEADRQGVDADVLDQVLGGGLDAVEVDRDQDAARPIDPLVDLGDRAAVDEVRDVDLEVVVELGGAGAAGEAEGVLEAGGDQHPDPRATQLGDRVGDHRGAVDEESGLGEQLLDREVEALRRDLDRLEHPAAEVVVGGQRLAALDLAADHDRDVGMGSADVHAHERIGLAAVTGHAHLFSSRRIRTRDQPALSDGAPQLFDATV